MCLRQAGFDPIHERVETGSAMDAALESREWELVISDDNMPSFSAPEALQLLRSKGLDLPFIIVSGSIGEDAAVAAMRAGAQDYLVKGQLARLPAAIERELDDAEARRARKDAEQKIRYLAYYDPLTSLPNRTHFSELLSHQFVTSMRSRTPLSVVGIKLENLREINNTLGYATGELVLAELAIHLRGAVDPPYVLGRIGGAEFAVLLPDTDLDAALRYVKQLQQAASQIVKVGSLELEVECSFGVAGHPSHAESAELLLQRMNVAMTQAADRTARVATYDAGRDPFKPHRLRLVSELRRAIAGEQLVLHYQPKVHFDTGRLVGVEALVRWCHPKRGMMRPDLFISLAEQTGLINPLTRWVLKEAFAQSRAWRDEGLNLGIAVNFSAKNLQNAELTGELTHWLSGPGEVEKLILEVTESAIMQDGLRAEEMLRKLRSQGVDIAIDDFGTGYSSFARLRELPVNEIKIDKSFVDRMARSTEDQIIVAAIIELGHKLGLQVVAEGVETPSSWKVLSELHCDLAQGYLLAKPMAAAEVLPWVQRFVPPAATHFETDIVAV